jgi:hypothetical protein
VVSDDANPQTLDRYSYVTNNPLRYADPTGHWADEGCGTGGSGGTGCNLPPPANHPSGGGSGGNSGQSSNNNSLPASVPITLSLQLGTAPAVQDYNGDYPGDMNVPYIPGVSPGIQGPIPANPCGNNPGPAAAACLFSFLTSLVPPANQPNANSNFTLSFNVTYKPGVGLSVSGIQWSNQYQGNAVFSYLKINNNVVQSGSSYMPKDGVFRPINGVYNSNSGIKIEGIVVAITSFPQGQSGMPYGLHYDLPPILK